MKNARQAWDEEQIARAVGFTTSRFLGTGRFDTRPFDTLAAAREDARGDRRAIVYAVTPEGFTIHIENGDRIGATEQTMTTTNPTFSSKSNAVRDAKKKLGAEAIAGTDFHLVSKGDRWFWSAGTGELSGNPGELPAKETREQARLRKIAEADARNAAKAAKAKEPKAPRAPKPAGAPKAGSKKAEALAAAERGEMPAAPDFSAETHKRFRKTLDALVVAANAGDLKTLKADKTEPKSSSRVTLCRYRDLCIVALEAQRKLPKAA